MERCDTCHQHVAPGPHTWPDGAACDGDTTEHRCPVCGVGVVLTRTGTVQRHDRFVLLDFKPAYRRCTGSGRRPAPRS
jgi:hypothetical protein